MKPKQLHHKILLIFFILPSMYETYLWYFTENTDLSYRFYIGFLSFIIYDLTD